MPYTTQAQEALIEETHNVTTLRGRDSFTKHEQIHSLKKSFITSNIL